MAPQSLITSAGNLYDFIVYCPVEKFLLSILRRFVSQVVEEMGFEENDRLKIEMAVDEACSNIVLHAYGEQVTNRQQGIELKLSMEPDALTIRIQDRGKGGQPEEFQGAASIEEYQQSERDEYRGLGILIMKDFMDEIHFSTKPEAGALVIMRKFLHPKQQGKATRRIGGRSKQDKPPARQDRTP